MRLLVAEDDPRLLKTLVHIFESHKFTVDGVSNGREALAYAQSMEYDGLVLDIMMPGLDGIQVLKELRRKGITTPAQTGPMPATQICSASASTNTIIAASLDITSRLLSYSRSSIFIFRRSACRSRRPL